MNFLFQSYPSHPWITDWTIEPRDCSAKYRENSAEHFFTSQETVGRIAPTVENQEWMFQVPVPQNSSIKLLFNGFCGYFEHKGLRCGAEIITPEPGVLWGRFTEIPDPVFVSDRPVSKQGEFQWLESEAVCGLLAIRNGVFCLITSTRNLEDAMKVAEDCFSRDLGQSLQTELYRRAGAVALFEEMAHHSSLAALCVESMMKALRPAEGGIPYVWSQASATDRPEFNINELHPLALAWSLIDIETAEELVLCALKLQTNAGAIPVHCPPSSTRSVLESPKPLLVKTAEKVWEIRKDETYLNTILPLLRRHVQWLLRHFDPKRRGIYCWLNHEEPIVPEIYETDMASVDLAALLLSEIEALNNLQNRSSMHAIQPPYFENERIALEHSILDQFWNDSESSFSTAYVRDSRVPLRGLPEFIPLLLKNLPNVQKGAILERLGESENLPGMPGVLKWRKSEMDDYSFSVPHHFLLFESLRNSDPHGTLLNDLTRLDLQRFAEWHSTSLETGKPLQLQPIMAAYIINLQAMPIHLDHTKTKIERPVLKVLRKTKTDRTDLLVIAATLIIIFGVHMLYDLKKSAPPLAMLEAQMNSAYAAMDPTETLRVCKAIIDYYPKEASKAKLLAANMLMINGEFNEARKLYAEVRKQYPDSPSAMISLGLSLQLQGQFAGADTNYYEFCYLFDEIFPSVVRQVNQFRYLMDEGFSTPPNWKKIYRYQFMHEL